MAQELRRVEIGFAGGQVTAARLDDGAISGLRGALEEGGAWHELEAVDGTLTLDLAQVVFLKVEGDEQSIGFRT